MKRTKLNAVSKDPKRRAKRFIPPASIAVVKARSGGRCEVYFVWGNGGSELVRSRHGYTHLETRCPNNSEPTPHHIQKRSQGGSHEPSNLLDVCFGCHRWIEDNSKLAIENGLTIPYANYKP